MSFFAPAEAHCFLELGWPLPPRWIDLWVEAKRLANGQETGASNLLSVMGRYGLNVRDSAYKKAMQELVGTGRWTQADLPSIVQYCREDVSPISAGSRKAR